MQAHFQYRLTRDEYVVGLGALLTQLGRQDTNRMSRLLEQLAVVLVILAVVAVAFPEAFVGLLVATLLLAILQELLRHRWIKGANGQSYDPAVADHDVEITDDAIVSRSELRDRRWVWSAVRRIHDCRKAIVLELAGWDMIILPDHLWAGSDARRAFLDETRALATDALPVELMRQPIMMDTYNLLTIGAIGAAVDTLFLIVSAFPAHRGPGSAISAAAFIGIFAAVLLVGLVFSYFVYRAAKTGLTRLYGAAPHAATAVAHLLIWALPLYMLIAYFGWI